MPTLVCDSGNSLSSRKKRLPKIQQVAENAVTLIKTIKVGERSWQLTKQILIHC